MTNNQLAENSVIQLLNSVKLARDNAERADNRVDHSFYYALTIALEELQERRKAAIDSEPDCKERKLFCSTDTSRMRKTISVSTGTGDAQLYRHAQPAPEYPETLPCPVLLEPGLRFSKGIKTSTMLAALARRAVHESDMAALSPEERVEFQARIEDFKALIAQPAPVVPDKMTAIVKDEAEYVEGWNACRAAMLQELKKSAGTEAICRSDENVQVLHTKSPAQSDCCPAQNHVSPEQNGDTPAQSQGWIQVSEQMPENDGAYLCWDNRYVTTYAFIFGAWQANQFVAKNITHWMPLPAAPQEVNRE